MVFQGTSTGGVGAYSGQLTIQSMAVALCPLLEVAAEEALDRMHALYLHFTGAPLSDYARAENHSAALLHCRSHVFSTALRFADFEKIRCTSSSTLRGHEAIFRYTVISVSKFF